MKRRIDNKRNLVNARTILGCDISSRKLKWIREDGRNKGKEWKRKKYRQCEHYQGELKKRNERKWNNGRENWWQKLCFALKLKSIHSKEKEREETEE